MLVSDKAILAFGEVLGEKEARTLLESYRNARITATRDANCRYYEEKFGKKELERDVKEYGRAVDIEMRSEGDLAPPKLLDRFATGAVSPPHAQNASQISQRKEA